MYSLRATHTLKSYTHAEVRGIVRCGCIGCIRTTTVWCEYFVALVVVGCEHFVTRGRGSFVPRRADAENHRQPSALVHALCRARALGLEQLRQERRNLLTLASTEIDRCVLVCVRVCVRVCMRVRARVCVWSVCVCVCTGYDLHVPHQSTTVIIYAACLLPERS